MPVALKGFALGKRSNFERNPRDFYASPYDVVLPLLKFLKLGQTFIEPCAGDGRLIDHFTRNGMRCVQAVDIEPGRFDVKRGDVLFMNSVKFKKADSIITNPPWDREIMHAMIDRFRSERPTWLLIDADWMHTIQAAPYMAFCSRIVSVGRVKWIEGSDSTGMDNCCWYEFQAEKCATTFYGRI